MAALLAFVVLAPSGGLLVWSPTPRRTNSSARDLERKVLARKEGWHYDGQRRAHRLPFTAVPMVSTGRCGTTATARQVAESACLLSSTNLRTRELALVILGRRRYQMESGPAGRLIIGVVSGVAQAMTARTARASPTSTRALSKSLGPSRLPRGVRLSRATGTCPRRG